MCTRARAHTHTHKHTHTGPDLPSYRGLTIINPRKFSMDAGSAPRDLLCRRARAPQNNSTYILDTGQRGCREASLEFYDQTRDTIFKLSWQHLFDMSQLEDTSTGIMGEDLHSDSVRLLVFSEASTRNVDFQNRNRNVASLIHGAIVT